MQSLCRSVRRHKSRRCLYACQRPLPDRWNGPRHPSIGAIWWLVLPLRVSSVEPENHHPIANRHLTGSHLCPLSLPRLQLNLERKNIVHARLSIMVCPQPQQLCSSYWLQPILKEDRPWPILHSEMRRPSQLIIEMNTPAKFEVRSFIRSWDNGGTQKIWTVPAHTPFSPKILKGFCSDGPVNIPAKFEVRSFIRSWDNRGYSKNLGSPCMRPGSIFSQIFNRLLLAWILWIYLPNLTFVALPIPEIIGGTSKIWGAPGFAHAPFLPNF